MCRRITQNHHVRQSRLRDKGDVVLLALGPLGWGTPDLRLTKSMHSFSAVSSPYKCAEILLKAVVRNVGKFPYLLSGSELEGKIDSLSLLYPSIKYKRSVTTKKKGEI